jgi:hypothetical protein
VLSPKLQQALRGGYVDMGGGGYRRIFSVSMDDGNERCPISAERCGRDERSSRAGDSEDAENIRRTALGAAKGWGGFRQLTA